MVVTDQTLHEKLLQVMDESQLWKGDQRRTHGFLLSPNVYEVSPDHQNQLNALCPALNECLAGFGRLVAIAQTPEFARTDAYKLIDTVANASAPNYYRRAQLRRPSCLPVVCKCDFMDDETDGTLKIAEIDGINKHGFGYGALVNRLRNTILGRYPDKCYPGIAQVIADEVKRRHTKAEGNAGIIRPSLPKIGLMAGEHERFYLPEFAIFADELACHGVGCEVVRENDLRVVNGDDGDEIEGLPSSLLVDLPTCGYNHGLSQALMSQYMKGELDFLLPPKSYLSSKGLMALLRNDEHNEDLECTLRSQIPGAALERVRRSIPPTYLITKRNLDFIRNDLVGSGTSYVLKAVTSSGMKGTVFMEDPGFETTLAELTQGRNGGYILQKEVSNKPETFSYFQPDGELRSDTWYKRVIVHFARGFVADMNITARRDKKVHGAKDCLQLGVRCLRTGGVY